MKNYFLKSFALSILLTMGFGACKKSNNPGGMVSPYISIFDVQKLFKGTEVNLSVKNLDGSDKLAGVVVSDHSGGNMPKDLLIIQDRRRLNKLRGIAINIGAAAANYVPGDSIHVNIDGGKLKRVDGILQITNVSSSAITKIADNKPIAVNRLNANEALAHPLLYENTLVTIVKATFNPTLGPSDILLGDKVINDGTDNITMHTATDATFANVIPPYSGNYTGIIFAIPSVDDTYIPQLRIRNQDDIRILSSVVDAPDFVISGFMSDLEGGDDNYEYVQFRALKNIDFSETPYSMVTSNNAGTSAPAGYPTKGWAMAGTRTYKIEMKTGSVSKGDFFYVGGTNKMINGDLSTLMDNSKWVAAINYSTVTSPLFYPGATESRTHAKGKFLANSGNASAIAVFKGLNVYPETAPMDVVFISNGGSLYQVGVAPTYGVGYKIANNDVYDAVDPITGEPQPYFLSGTNKVYLNYASGNLVNAGAFNLLGGIFDTTLNKWVKARSQTFVDLSKTSTIDEIENATSTEVK